MNVTPGSFFKTVPVQLAGLIAILFAAELQAASIVHVTYVLNDKPLGSAIYTGSDGGHSSDPVPYWSLISTPPEFGEIHSHAKPWILALACHPGWGVHRYRVGGRSTSRGHATCHTHVAPRPRC